MWFMASGQHIRLACMRACLAIRRLACVIYAYTKRKVQASSASSRAQIERVALAHQIPHHRLLSAS